MLQQLNELNSKMRVQDSDILNLLDQLKKCQAAQDFYRQQALKADKVTPCSRCPFVSSAADIALSPAQHHQYLLLASDDIQVRNNTLDRLHLKHTHLQNSFEQVLTSSSELLALHVSLLEHHLDLYARQQECDSSFSLCQTKLLAADIRFKQTESQLLKQRAWYDNIVSQVTYEDLILKRIV